MKTLIAAAALSFVAGAAFAGEGAGNPFPFNAPPVSVSLNGWKQAKGNDQNPYPFNTPGTMVRTMAVLPSAGQNGEVQTANSLPKGFEDGAASTNLNNQAAPATRLAQPVAPASATDG